MKRAANPKSINEISDQIDSISNLINQNRTDEIVNFFPANFLLDSKGKIMAKNLEPSQIEEFLKEN